MRDIASLIVRGHSAGFTANEAACSPALLFLILYLPVHSPTAVSELY